MHKSGRFERKKEKKPFNGKRLALILTAGLLAVILGVIGFLFRGIDSIADKMTQVSVPTIIYTKPTEEASQLDETAQTTSPMETTQPHVASSADYINFLLVGQAARAGEAERFADTMILCTVNTHTKSLTMTSLLRDSFVKMPDYKGRIGGRIKLTTIYHLGSIYGDGVAGSMELMNMTLYNNFGIEVDHNFEIDFDAFIKVVDLLGGIEVELTQAEADYLNADDFWVYYDVQPGWQSLDGMGALSYVRMRKAAGDGESDIIRTSRQRRLMEAVFRKMKGRSLSELKEIADEVLPLITTSMNTAQISDTLLKLLPMLPDLTIEFSGTCPANYQGDTVDIYSDGVPHSVLRFDVAETTKYMRAITEGETE